MSATDEWRRALQAWDLPDAILTAAPESPWTIPVELLENRTRQLLARCPSPANERALQALPERGTVLDVGVGPGAASLPLAGRAAHLIGVDASQEMLTRFRQAAAQHDVDVQTVLGDWVQIAGKVEPADVAVCHHVVYNVPDIAPFIQQLDSHARHRVVIELPANYPWAWLADLWEHFHDLKRPDGPTSDTLHRALEELGINAWRHDHQRPPTGGFNKRSTAVAVVRRRLCLPADRDPEVAAALGDRLTRRDGLWTIGPPTRTTVTLWWDP